MENPRTAVKVYMLVLYLDLRTGLRLTALTKEIASKREILD